MKKALVVGLGLSGKAAIELLLQQGYVVTGVDQHDKKAEMQEFIKKGVHITTEHALNRERFSLSVSSSGVPRSHPCLQLGDEILCEAELGLREISSPVVAVTGTNGKTTIALLTEHVLRHAGFSAKAFGNIGEPITKYALHPHVDDVLVLELSSFQLETLKRRCVLSGVITNITPDHLDRYSSMQEYAKAKANLQYLIRQEGALYVGERVLQEYASLLPTSTLSLSYAEAEEFLQGHAEFAHDKWNGFAAWKLCAPFGVSREMFLGAYRSFKKPKHRMEFVHTWKGVSYIDDSKGTNIDAVIQAVSGLDRPVILIVGGVDKGASYMPWKEAFCGRVKQLIALGQAAPKIARELALFFNLQIVDSLEKAVSMSSQIAKEGDVVLLSPGCSSFDMFRDYAHRGAMFQQFVRRLGEEE